MLSNRNKVESYSGNMKVLLNIMKCKECNYFECQKKNVELMKCKCCKSVYYCSRLCQKKDWKLSAKNHPAHRYVCRKSKQRKYSVTLHPQY